jgi:YfiH family protein
MPVSWIAAEWPAPAGVVAGTTRRHSGRSEGEFASLNLGAHVGDDPEAVRENRRRFREHCALPSEPLWIDQVHGATVVVDPRAASYPEADAIVSRKREAVCAVLTADCLPVVLTAGDGSEVAAIHAGWRGLLLGVLEATVDTMHAEPADILAWFGPAISQPAFEVGGEVRESFLRDDPHAARFFEANDNARWQADLAGLARRRLAGAGVTRVFGGDFCTYADPGSFFSYRRVGQCGRMATFIFRANA